MATGNGCTIYVDSIIFTFSVCKFDYLHNIFMRKFFEKSTHPSTKVKSINSNMQLSDQH